MKFYTWLERARKDLSNNMYNLYQRMNKTTKIYA